MKATVFDAVESYYDEQQYVNRYMGFEDTMIQDNKWKSYGTGFHRRDRGQ